MTEWVLRARYNDHVVLTELLTDPAALPPRLSRMIRRVVVDATAIVNQPAFAQAAYASGTQLLIDPQTMFLTTEQDPTDSWARLPFATSAAVAPRDLLDPAARAALIDAVVEFQIDHGATAVIPPYLHLTGFDDAGARVQRKLFKETEAHLATIGLNFPVFPVISVDQRAVSLDAEHWREDLGRLVKAARRHTTGPIGLGLSMTTGPNKTNLHVAARIWRRAARLTPFVAWHAGETGLLAVAMGAEGYEAGMCTAERYDVHGDQRTRIGVPTPGPRYTGAFIESIGRSLDRRTVEHLSTVRGIHQADLVCSDPTCCPRGFVSTLGAGRRQHAARARLRDLEALSAIATRKWRLRHLAMRAQNATASARRIRAAANNTGLRIGAHPQEIEAMYLVTQSLQSTARVAGGVA